MKIRRRGVLKFLLATLCLPSAAGARRGCQCRWRLSRALSSSNANGSEAVFWPMGVGGGTGPTPTRRRPAPEGDAALALNLTLPGRGQIEDALARRCARCIGGLALHHKGNSISGHRGFWSTAINKTPTSGGAVAASATAQL
jgi:hypothetical protein